MKNVNFGVLIFTVSFCALQALSCNAGPPTAIPATIVNNSTIGHRYFQELSELTFNITDDLNNIGTRNGYLFPSPFQGSFVSQEVVIDKRDANIEKTALIFQTDTGSKAYILIPKGIIDRVNMVPTETYQIKYDIIGGWPFAYRLLINKGNEMALAGIAAGSLESKWSLNGLVPVKANQSKILTDNYIDGNKDVFWDRKTNTEVTFTFDGNSVNLHQGQSAALGDYEVKLLIARQIKYKPNLYDAGQNSISYVVARK